MAAPLKLKDRLRVAMVTQGIGVNELERGIQASKGSISRTLNRKNPTMRPDRLRKAAAYLEIEFAWLAWGDGPMMRETPSKSRVHPKG